MEDRLAPQDLINRLLEQMINYKDISILPFYFFNAMVTGDLPDLTQRDMGHATPERDY